jgi:hypothetical protein
MKFIDFLLFLRVIFAFLDPDLIRIGIPNTAFRNGCPYSGSITKQMRARGSASDPLYLEGKPRDELIRKRNQVLRPHRRLGQSGIHQEDLDKRLFLLLRDAGDTTALPDVVDAHSDQGADYAAPRGSVVVYRVKNTNFSRPESGSRNFL